MEFAAATSQLRDVVTDVLDKKGVLARIKVHVSVHQMRSLTRLQISNLCL
jgi:hypothetical protein